ncbi:hypothetical protein COOONC_04199 [Cooperia oncophora]
MLGIMGPGSCLETSSANSEPMQQRATTGITSSRRGAYWSDSEVNKLVQLVQLHKTEKGRVRWDDLSSAWESSRSTNDPPRSKEALRGTYARLVKRRGRATPIELGDAAELLTSSHSGSLFSNNTEEVRHKGALWSADELTKLAELVERHRIASGRIMWADVKEQKQPSVLSESPLVCAWVKAAYTNLARRTERGTVRNAPPAENTLEEESQPATTETDLINQDSQQGGVEPVEHIEERSTSPNGDSETSQPDRTLGDKLRERFDAYYKAAKESHDRQPIRRPKGEIPEGMLQLANEILSEKLGHTNSTNKRTLTALNAAVYAIAKAITTILLDGEAEKAGKTHQKLREAKALRDTLRLRIRFKDQLKVVNSEIKTIEQALRRQRERQRGYPAVPAAFLVTRKPRER